MSVEVEGLTETLNYFKGLGSRIESAQAKAISSAGARARMVDDARSIMDSVVYSVPEGDFYTRTENMLNELAADDDGNGGVTIGLPVNFLTEAVAGADRGQVTYARYMLPEFFSLSFFTGKAKETIPRDFLTAWHNFYGETIPTAFDQALDQELQR